jgi:hypothetical protein
MNKITILLLLLINLSFGLPKISFLFKYDYGFPLKQSFLGESIIKRNYSETSYFDKKESIYSSFGKGNNLSIGARLYYLQNLPFVLLFNYHLPARIVIKRDLQGYDDSDMWEFSFFSINYGFEFRKAINANNTVFIGLYPGFYMPNPVGRSGYFTSVDEYNNVVFDQQTEYSYPVIFQNNMGLLSSFGIEHLIGKKLSVFISVSPEVIFSDADYNLSYKKYSFSSIRASIGISYL